MSYPTYLNPVERAVRDEREAQDRTWGEQNHPDGTATTEMRTFAAEQHRRLCKEAAERGDVTWRHILLEEVHEAFAETDPVRLRAELIQVAAVAQAWAEAIDRRTTHANTTKEPDPR